MEHNVEKERLAASVNNTNWKKWGPYVSDRQWATVREDYSEHGDAWGHVSHDISRSYAYRWGEDAIAGFCDADQILCLAPAFWNGRDPIIKERLFGLTNNQGNHGEDVKELYYHLDSSPTHSYCKFLYKYPHSKYPYHDLIHHNHRSKLEEEYEIFDTDAFKNNRYFDCYIEYAKADPYDILLKITVHNRGKRKAPIHILPHFWYRNYWRHNSRYEKPEITSADDNCIRAKSIRNGKYYLYHEEGIQLFCENETNETRISGQPNLFEFVKDGINDHVVEARETVDPEKKGTKSAVWIIKDVPAGESVQVRIRLSKRKLKDPWFNYDHIIESRIRETNDFYQGIIPHHLSDNHKNLMRKAFAGLLWTKQYYYLDVFKWLFGEPGGDKPRRHYPRNYHWQHMTNRHIISMPDKWEYPWYAVWDLAFHATTFAEIDPDFAKEQLLIFLREDYQHPSGQIPAYEWNFSDVNPPVHSWAVWQVFERDKAANGKPDWEFLEKAFHKLTLNYNWWINQKDKDGTSLFEGGFLGLDNIGVFDRSNMPAGIKDMQQADATSWMAMFSLDMLRMSVELAQHNPVYEEMAAKFFRHFLNIAWSMHHMGETKISLWDDEDAFYYDVVRMHSGVNAKLKVRSLVGVIPLFAIEVFDKILFDGLKKFKSRAINIIRNRPDLAAWISRIEEVGVNKNYLFSLMRGFRLEHLLKRMLDENEFLSDFGIRSLSKIHEKEPFQFQHHGHHMIKYEPGESSSRMFGGNSNWRGPIWLPLNYLIIQSLRKYYDYYGPEYIYEFPNGSGNMLNLKQIAQELTKRVLRLFERDETGKYRYHTDDPEHKYAEDPHFSDHHLFYEFFHGDNGRGLGASHQTGWSALIANLLLEMDE